MKIFLIVIGAIAALWIVWLFSKLIFAKLRSKPTEDDDREAVDKWVKETGINRSLEYRGQSTRSGQR